MPGSPGEKKGLAGWVDLHGLLGKQLSEELSAQRSALLTNRISPEPGAGRGGGWGANLSTVSVLRHKLGSLPYLGRQN